MPSNLSHPRPWHLHPPDTAAGNMARGTVCQGEAARVGLPKASRFHPEPSIQDLHPLAWHGKTTLHASASWILSVLPISVTQTLSPFNPAAKTNHRKTQWAINVPACHSSLCHRVGQWGRVAMGISLTGPHGLCPHGCHCLCWHFLRTLIGISG